VQGKVNLLREQIVQEDALRSEKVRSKEQRVADHQQKIEETFGLIHELSEAVEKNRISTEGIRMVDQRIQELEDKEYTVTEVLEHLNALLANVGVRLDGWEEKLEKQRLEIGEKEEKLRKESIAVVDLQEACVHYEGRYSSFKEGHEGLCRETELRVAVLKERIRECEVDREVIEKNLVLDKEVYDRKVCRMEKIKVVLAGAIHCPACSHEFAPSDGGENVSLLREEMGTLQREMAVLRKGMEDAVEGIWLKDEDKRCLEKEWWGLDKKISDSETELSLRKSEWNRLCGCMRIF